MTLLNPLAIPTLGNAELQGDIFYVDGNRPNDGGSGKSWADAYQKLATGLAVSHADIGRTADRQWAGRNTVYVKGDALTEDLVALAQKTDVIGVGSYNAGKQAGLIGNHVIVGTYAGCRFFNFRFEEVDTGIVWTAPTGATGLEFHSCVWSARGTNPTIGLKTTAVYALKVINCQFESVNGYSTACINLKSGVSDDTIIQGCDIGGAIGILIDNGVTTVAGHIRIDKCDFNNLTLCVDDNSIAGTGSARITNCTMISAAACGAAGGTIGNCLDYNARLAANNFLSGSDGNIRAPATDGEY